uniref:Corticosteroid-binding globulin n=1 Tax=Castor canadensis TaxID=51338 RepID=A0A8C0WNX1_CASCN
MLLAFCTCLLWLSTIGLWTVQAKLPNATVSTSSLPRGLAPTNVDFAFSLYQHLVALAPDRNIFISPVSISMALAMLSLGTSGHTKTQLLQGLGFNLTEMSENEIHQGFQYLHCLLEGSDTSLEMTMGSALFLDRSLELQELFSADVKRYYESEALAIDFQDWARASRQINEYIKNKTQGKIGDVFSDLDSPAILTMVDYIFFKGTWAHFFDPKRTREMNFYVNETMTVKVPMMFQSSSIQYLHDSVLPCQLVQLYYVGNGTVFFVLPDQGKMDTVINALSRDTIQRWSSSLTRRSQVELRIPKVSIANLFTEHADLSGITQGAPLEGPKVVHKAVLQLDEKGQKPAPPRKVAPKQDMEPPTIHFNRPFLIMIFDDYTWSSLVLGKVMNPT